MGEFKQRRFSKGSSSGFTGKPFDRSRFFSKDKPEGRLQRFDSEPPRRRESELELFKATCDKCKSECELPFKPRGNRPVLCRDCFKQSEKSKSDRGSDDFPSRPRSSERSSFSSSVSPSSDELSKINRKLDKIMRALKID